MQKNSPGTERENILLGNLYIIKMNVRHQRKAIFSIKKYLPIQSMNLAVLKTLNTHGGVILTLSFPDNIIFLEKLLFQLYPISLPIIKGMVSFTWKLMLSKTTEYLSMSLVTQKRISFVPLVWSCFWHVLALSSLLWLVTGCSTFYKRRSHKMFWLTNLP